MKILILAATLDLKKPYSATPFILQWFKAFNEEGHQLFIIPYNGKSIKSEWWESYPNPNYTKGVVLENIIKFVDHDSNKKNSSIIPILAQIFVKPNLEKAIRKILDKEKDISAIINMGLPLNQLKGLAHDLKKKYNLPIFFFDVDLPTSLPENGGFTFDYYNGANLGEYDSFIITSEGSKSRLKEMGALSVEVVHIGIDPNEYKPMELEKDLDIFFYGHNGNSREKFVKMMVTEPSKVLDYKFLIGGRDYSMDLGKASYITEKIDFIKWKELSSRAKINLNLVHELHATTYATSTARIFELSALRCCVVSSPYEGLEKWFEPKKEIFIANSPNEAIELYQTLMEDSELRLKIGLAAEKRVKKDHTARNRVREVIDIIRKYQNKL